MDIWPQDQKSMTKMQTIDLGRYLSYEPKSEGHYLSNLRSFSFYFPKKYNFREVWDVYWLESKAKSVPSFT